jgi:protein-disulfide isomerase
VVLGRYRTAHAVSGYDGSVTVKRGGLLLLLAVLCFAEEAWQTAATLPGVDLSGLSPAAQKAALAILRSEGCSCGCGQKIAECRMKDQSCGTSRRLAGFVIQELNAGKSPEVARTDLHKFAAEPPPVLEKPVKLSIAGDPMKGPADAKVTVVEFSDFQCPYCAIAVGEANKLLQKFPKDVRLVFKQFPLDIHSQAAMAAEAALAAQAQGKFWELHDRMYANYRAISATRILAWAQEIGLDMNRFRADLTSRKYAARVAAEEQEGENAGVEGTPTFFLNGKRFNGVFDLETVAPLVAEELKH